MSGPNNVYHFPRRLPGAVEPMAPANDDAPVGDPRPAGGRFLGAILYGLRYFVFLVLFWLRGPIVGLAGFLSVVSLIGFLVAFFFLPEKKEMVWGCGVFSFVSFAFVWGYDRLLMALSPVDMIQSL